jgi:hypothetical protein
VLLSSLEAVVAFMTYLCFSNLQCDKLKGNQMKPKDLQKRIVSQDPAIIQAELKRWGMWMESPHNCLTIAGNLEIFYCQKKPSIHVWFRFPPQEEREYMQLLLQLTERGSLPAGKIPIAVLAPSRYMERGHLEELK